MLNTKNFDSILLEEMDQVKLMNRTDRKYWFYIGQLNDLLQTIQSDYYLLHIDGNSLLPYSTTYYDTSKNNMFISHHNGKLNRYKIRRRSYVNSGISFLEVKFKNNKGRTQKKRMPADFGNTVFTNDENEFLNRHSPFTSSQLKPSLMNEFYRLTLVNKNFKERCTIDLNLQFQNNGKSVVYDNLVIIEIKADGKSYVSPLATALRDNRIKAAGFSKYCVGRTVIDPDLKSNNFKRKIRKLNKTIQINYN